MKQQDLDALAASGLKPIVIDENFDFSQLGAMLGLPEIDNEQVVISTEEAATDAGQGSVLPET